MHAAAAAPTSSATDPGEATGGQPGFSGRSCRLVIVGDVHDAWGPRDVAALQHLAPDMVLFVGDFGNENLKLVSEVRQIQEWDETELILRHQQACRGLRSVPISTSIPLGCISFRAPMTMRGWPALTQDSGIN